MAVTLNIKAQQNPKELFKGMIPAGDLLNNCLDDCEIWYQKSSFDLIMKLELDGVPVVYCARIIYDKTGPLMAGTLGLKPLADFGTSFKYLLKRVSVHLVKIEQDYDLNGSAISMKATNASGVHGLYSSYANFLTVIGDVKAIPQGQSSDLNKKPTVLDFSKLEAHVAASKVDNFNQQSATIVTSDGNTPPVRLSQVEALGQAALGSSSTSVYYVAAIGPMVALAYRLNLASKTLSIRVEPRASVKLASGCEIAEKIKSADLTPYSEEGNLDYASLHVSVMSVKEARRVLGAVVADLDMFSPAGMDLKIKG